MLSVTPSSITLRAPIRSSSFPFATNLEAAAAAKTRKKRNWAHADSCAHGCSGECLWHWRLEPKRTKPRIRVSKCVHWCWYSYHDFVLQAWPSQAVVTTVNFVVCNKQSTAIASSQSQPGAPHFVQLSRQEWLRLLHHAPQSFEPETMRWSWRSLLNHCEKEACGLRSMAACF